MRAMMGPTCATAAPKTHPSGVGTKWWFACCVAATVVVLLVGEISHGRGQILVEAHRRELTEVKLDSGDKPREYEGSLDCQMEGLARLAPTETDGLAATRVGALE